MTGTRNPSASSRSRALRVEDADRALASRARDGDADAFAELVRRHQAVALRVAALVGPAGEAEDACQEAFLKAYRSLARYDTDRPFRPWLLLVEAEPREARQQRPRADARQRAILLRGRVERRQRRGALQYPRHAA